MSATALAHSLSTSPTQLANHLRRLRETGLVTVTHESRLAIYQLAEPGLREIFSMLNGLRGGPVTQTHPASEAASCYDHLAGRLGVALFDYLIAREALEPRDGEGQLTLGPHAAEVFSTLGVEQPLAHSRRMPAYACLDSTLRRAHLGGRLGASMANSLTSRGWVRASDQPRQLMLTGEGRRGLTHLGLRI